MRGQPVYDVRLYKHNAESRNSSHKNRGAHQQLVAAKLHTDTGMTFGDLSLVKHDNNKTRVAMLQLFSHWILFFRGIRNTRGN